MNTGLGSLKTASKNVIYKAGEFLRNEIADVVTMSNNVKPDDNPRNAE